MSADSFYFIGDGRSFAIVRRSSITLRRFSVTVRRSFSVKGRSFSSLRHRGKVLRFVADYKIFRRHTVDGCNISLRLCGKQLVVQSVLLHKLSVVAYLNDSTVFKNDDFVRHSRRGKPVRDEYCCLILAQPVELVVYLLLCYCVKAGGRFIKVITSESL